MAIPTILKQPVNYLQAAYNKIMYCFRSTNYTAPTPTEVAINLSQQIGNDPTYYAVQDGNTVEFLGVTFTFRSFNPPSPLTYEMQIDITTPSALNEENNLLSFITAVQQYAFFKDFYDWRWEGITPNRHLVIFKTDPDDFDIPNPTEVIGFLGTDFGGLNGMSSGLETQGSAGFSDDSFALGVNIHLINPLNDIVISKTGVVVIEGSNQFKDACFDIQNFVQPNVLTKLPDRASLATFLHEEGLLFYFLEYYEIFGTPPLPQIKYRTRTTAVVNASVTYTFLEDKMKDYSLLDLGAGFKFLTELPDVHICPNEKYWLYLALPSKFDLDLQGKLYVRTKLPNGNTDDEFNITIDHKRGVMIIPVHKAALADIGVAFSLDDKCYYIEWRTIGQENFIGGNLSTLDDEFNIGTITTDVNYIPARPTFVFGSVQTGTVLVGLESFALTKGKTYQLRIGLKELFADITGGAVASYQLIPRLGVAYADDTITVVSTGLQADGFVETWVTAEEDTVIFVDLWFFTPIVDLNTPNPLAYVEFFDFTVTEYSVYPAVTSEEFKICNTDCCNCDIEIKYLNRVGGMDKIKGCPLVNDIETTEDVYYHDEAEVIGDREFLSVNSLSTNGIIVEFDYAKPNMKALVKGLIETSDAWIVKDDEWHPILVEKGAYQLDEKGKQIFTTVKITDGHLNRRQHIM